MVEFYIKDNTRYNYGRNRIEKYTEKELESTRPHWAGFDDLYVRISAVTVARHTDYATSHWSLLLHADNGKLIKVDLVMDCYRIIYGAEAPKPGYCVSVDKLPLEGDRTVTDVFELAFKLAKHNGVWRGKGVNPYSCQDFVLAFLDGFGMSDSQIFPYELRRTVTRWRPSLITEYNDSELKYFGLRVFVRGY